MDKTDKYDDIIDLPCHISESHPRMSVHDRAAQFASFAALTGYESAVEEAARQTEKRKEPDEYENARLDNRLRRIMERMDEQPEVKITYFIPDSKKDGGAYHTVFGSIRKINLCDRIIIMEDGTNIPIDEIAEIDT